MLTPTQVHSSVDFTVSNGYALNEYETRNIEYPMEQLILGTGDAHVIPICQRLIAALIPEEDYGSGSEDLKVEAYGTEFDLDGELESNSLDHQSLVSFQVAGHTTFNSYRITGKPEHDELETNILSIPNKSMNSNFGHSINGLILDQASMASRACSDFQYCNMQLNEKILLEIQSIGIYPETVVGLILQPKFLFLFCIYFVQLYCFIYQLYLITNLVF